MSQSPLEIAAQACIATPITPEELKKIKQHVLIALHIYVRNDRLLNANGSRKLKDTPSLMNRVEEFVVSHLKQKGSLCDQLTALKDPAHAADILMPIFRLPKMQTLIDNILINVVFCNPQTPHTFFEDQGIALVIFQDVLALRRTISSTAQQYSMNELIDVMREACKISRYVCDAEIMRLVKNRKLKISKNKRPYENSTVGGELATIAQQPLTRQMAIRALPTANTLFNSLMESAINAKVEDFESKVSHRNYAIAGLSILSVGLVATMYRQRKSGNPHKFNMPEDFDPALGYTRTDLPIYTPKG